MYLSRATCHAVIVTKVTNHPPTHPQTHPPHAVIVKKVTKRNAWLLWSLVVALSHLLLGFADKGDVNMAIG